jgi:hypothetical protein
MLRAGYVDVALVFRYSAGTPEARDGADARETPVAPDAPVALFAPGEPGADFYGGLGPADDDAAIDLTQGLRERLLLEEPVYLVTSVHDAEASCADLSRYARHRWIAGCDRCRAHLLRQCALAGFTPKIAFTTDDYVAVQALVATELGVSTLPALCLRAARHPGIKTIPLPGTHRYVYAVRYGDPPDPPAVRLLMDVLRTAAMPPQRTSGSMATEAKAEAKAVRLQLPGAPS